MNERWNGLAGCRCACPRVWMLIALVACSGCQGSRLASDEDCAAPGDENGDGRADCADRACGAFPACQAVCGNHRRDVGEACDDGNVLDGDGCDHNCQATGCGNGVVTAGEACDDGGRADGDGCDRDCSVTACGNGIVTVGEDCEDGNAVDGDGCDHNCRTTGCGNGVITAGEDCDDGNEIDGDGCDQDCSVTACGNEIVTAGEDCDDGNGVDGDGCASCHFAACPVEVPVAPGAGGSFPVAGQIAKLVADPASCFLYALDTASPSHLVVISTASKRVLTQVTLLEDATDIEVSPSGTYLVISYATNAIGIIDTAIWQQTVRVPTFAGPVAVAVRDNGIAFYSDVRTIMHRIDLRDGSGDGGGFSSGGDLSLSRDGRSLYIGDWGNLNGELRRYDVAGGAAVLIDRGDGGGGFDYPERHVYASPGAQHVYYADHQLDGASLATVRGATGELIFAEDVAGTFAVGARHVFDAQLVRPVAALPQTASAAALTGGDDELWYHSPDTGQIYYLSPEDMIGGVTLGAREVAAPPVMRGTGGPVSVLERAR